MLPASRWFFAWLILLPEDEGDMFLRNAVDVQRTTWHYILEYETLHNHSCENLESYMHIFFPSYLNAVISEIGLNLKYYFGVDLCECC
jgi:hypothetical protein